MIASRQGSGVGLPRTNGKKTTTIHMAHASSPMRNSTLTTKSGYGRKRDRPDIADTVDGSGELLRTVSNHRTPGSWRTREFFEQVVTETLEELPDEIYERLDNLAVVVEDRDSCDASLLGLFEGISLLDRGIDYAGVLPDRISIFIGAHLDLGLDRRGTAAEIRRTVLHEIGHHLGIDDHRLDELGWS